MPTAKFYPTATDQEGSASYTGATAPPSTTFVTYDSGQWLVQKNLVSTTYEYSVALIRFDTSGIPDDATITAASLVLRLAQKVDGATTFNLEGDYYDFGGKPSVAGDWIETVAASIFTPVDLGTLPASGNWISPIALTDLSGINKTGFTGIRLAMSAGTPPGGQNLIGANSYVQNAQSIYLQVTYTLATTVFHVDVDAVTEGMRTDTSDPYTFVHTPVGVPDGVLVSTAHGVTATDHVQGVTYGGVALTKVVTGNTTSGEPGVTDLWFLGSGVPSGAQTVSVDLDTGTADDIEVICVTLVSNDGADLEVITTGSISNTAVGTVGNVTLSYGGREAMAFAAIYSGVISYHTVLSLPGNETVEYNEYGSYNTKLVRQSFPGTANFTVGATQVSDDICVAAAAIGRVVGPAPPSTVYAYRRRVVTR